MTRVRGVLLALTFSGFAGLVNQVIWQRALRLYLGGSEALSGMIVVLVFLLGLSLGSAVAGRSAPRLKRPLRVLAGVEISLAGFNLLVSWLLSQDLSQSLLFLNKLAMLSHAPLRLIYALASLLLLIPPCLLMGATTPLAAQGLQREKSSLTHLVVLNTLGACVGALTAGLVWLPWLGQAHSLRLAVAANALAGLICLGCGDPPPLPRESCGSATSAVPAGGVYRRWEILALTTLFGAISLLYEMWLLRALSLAWLPLPTTFAVGITLFLLCWNLGVACTSWTRGKCWWPVLGATLTLALAPGWLALDRAELLPWWGRAGYFLPCWFFGLSYGAWVRQVGNQWGRDLGDFLACNTFGSCLGVLLGQLLGYRCSPWLFASLQTLALAAATLYVLTKERRWLGRQYLLLLPLGMALYASSFLVFSLGDIRRSYHSIDGVVEIRRDQVFLDGLWHSSFYQPQQASNDWYMAAVPTLCHSQPEAICDALVVGFGLGRTALALTGLPRLERIEAYEINQGLRQLLQDYPQETGGVLQHPKVKVLWQDGRSGLALRPQQYDLITSAPLYLKQSGSSALLSREYFRLVLSRLKPGGVAAIYSRPETAAQGLLVRQTFAQVFPYYESFNGGYLLIGSAQPLDVTPAAIERRLALEGRLFQESRDPNRQLSLRLDRNRLSWQGFRLCLSDDHPLVEYPNWLQRFRQ